MTWSAKKDRTSEPLPVDLYADLSGAARPTSRMPELLSAAGLVIVLVVLVAVLLARG